MEQDPFDSILGLEDTYYREGYDLGVADGSKAGRVEGRVFGLEKGFEKFAAMGALHGKATVWASRLQSKKELGKSGTALMEENDTSINANGASDGHNGKVRSARHPFPGVPTVLRLEKHVQTLYALAEPDSLSTQNTEDTVADFDDRFKRAQAKVKIVERLMGDGNLDSVLQKASSSSSDIKDRQLKISRNDRADSNMEDFGNVQSRR